MSKEINIQNTKANTYDFHRIVMHYVYLNEPGCRMKADNYVALYGFLRSTSLILVLFTDWATFIGIRTMFFNFSGQLSWASFIMILSLWLVSCVSFLGFVKFYRRFTHENFMTLLTCKWHKEGYKKIVRNTVFVRKN